MQKLFILEHFPLIHDKLCIFQIDDFSIVIGRVGAHCTTGTSASTVHGSTSSTILLSCTGVAARRRHYTQAATGTASASGSAAPPAAAAVRAIDIAIGYR